MNAIKGFLKYLREHQSPPVFFLHITILALVVSQIVVSNFMGFGGDGGVSRNTVAYFGTWVHIGTGLFLVPIALLFVFVEFNRHGFQHFFPYLFGNTTQLKNDFQQLKKFKLPEASDYGIAVAVQGLGLGALALVLLSGLIWFLSWRFVPQWAGGLREIHEALTGLIQAYLVGHGGMGLLHVFFESRRQGARLSSDRASVR